MANSVGSVKPIVTDGLVFCLDALDIDSYPRSGTDWNSVVGNNSGSITNAVFDSNGHFVFTSDYVICNNIASTIEDDSTGSIGFWFNFDEADSSNQYDCIFSLGKLSTDWNNNKYGVYINYGPLNYILDFIQLLVVLVLEQIMVMHYLIQLIIILLGQVPEKYILMVLNMLTFLQQGG